MYTRRRALIVDGFNVLRSGTRYQHIPSPNPDYDSDAYNRIREKLINDVANYAGHEFDATIVFDGANNEFSTGEPEMVGGVRVIFSPSGQSADKVIEKLARESREHGVEVLVVTSDATIQNTVFGSGVDRMSANGFSYEAAHYDEEVVIDNSPAVRPKNTIEERIDSKTLAKLKALRDQR